jgi:hypothetical protein
MKLTAVVLLLLLAQSGLSRRAPACQWSRGTEVGRIGEPIDEDSGLAVSRRFPNRLYHVNDSGDSGRFFITDHAGGRTQIVNVKGFAPRDDEDLALGPCSASTDCLFIGDTGDNNARRGSIELVIVEERERFPAVVEPFRRVTVRYPNGPHDAEALGVHPDGSVYILTKRDRPPQLFRLKRDQWLQATGPQTLEFVGPIDFVRLGADANENRGPMPTAMDIARDGTRALVLTYREAFELFVDFAKPMPAVGGWQVGRDFRKIDVAVLSQQEGIAYDRDEQAFLYDSEFNGNGSAPIMRSACR